MQTAIYNPGVTLDSNGARFTVYSSNATRIDLCLFETINSEIESRKIPLIKYRDGIWSVFVEGIKEYQLYGYRVEGLYDAYLGLRYDYEKVLLDPYAKAVPRKPSWDKSLLSYEMNSENEDLIYCKNNNSKFAALGAVVKNDFDWENDQFPNIPLKDTIIYEGHIKGLTMLNAKIPKQYRGKYLGLSSEPMITHLKNLGITTIKLLPIQTNFSEYHLFKHGLVNYWGYNTLNFFSPESSYATGQAFDDPIIEFKQMVKTLHREGFEVILDVVFNHSPEGNHLGPTLSLRGFDNRSYYHLVNNNPRLYQNYTGCGNTLKTYHPKTLQLIMDSLRYWISEMHVDGFRFDLAVSLCRTDRGFEYYSPFLNAIAQDPIISKTKLIAEPWDIEMGGYQLGNFPKYWSEWNDRYRDEVRQMWLTDSQSVPLFATRFAGSHDLFSESPLSNVNFITAHDGFTLEDLVCYTNKHNEANFEQNTDGRNANYSNNFGVEGPTDNPDINKLRLKHKKNLITSLLFSQGIPMILAGDELSRTQKGNNNAYCQDNQISWLHWNSSEKDLEFFNFFSEIIKLRKEFKVFSREDFFKTEQNNDQQEIIWIKSDGERFASEDWDNNNGFLGTLLKVSDHSQFTHLYIAFNFSKENIVSNFPISYNKDYLLLFTTSEFSDLMRQNEFQNSFEIEKKSIILFGRIK